MFLLQSSDFHTMVRNSLGHTILACFITIYWQFKMFEKKSDCRCCGKSDFAPLLDMGMMPLANSLHLKGEVSERYPLNVHVCTTTGARETGRYQSRSVCTTVGRSYHRYDPDWRSAQRITRSNSMNARVTVFRGPSMQAQILPMLITTSATPTT